LDVYKPGDVPNGRTARRTKLDLLIYQSVGGSRKAGRGPGADRR